MDTLATLRQAAGLTQQKLADAVGITLRRYQKYEYGNVPLDCAEAGTVVKLAKALGTTAEALISTPRP